jgi:hypothetical protein
MLMSDDVDDDHKVDGVDDDALNDRSHKVALDGTVKVEYQTSDGQTCRDEASVPNKKSVHVNVIILRDKAQADGGTPVQTQADVEAKWKIVTERYGQVGTLVTWDVDIKDPPAGVDLSDGLLVRPTSASKRLTAEAKALIEGLGTKGAANDIHAFHVNEIKVGTGGAYGSAVADYWYDAAEDDYLYNLFLDPTANKIFTPPHELAHLLVDTGHEASPVNVLQTSTSISNTVGATKRFTETQETKIHASPRVQ